MRAIGKVIPLVCSLFFFFGCTEDQKNTENNNTLFSITDEGVIINDENGNNIINIGDDGVNIQGSSGENILKINNSGITLDNPEKITQILSGALDATEINMQDLQDLTKLDQAGYLDNIDLSAIHIQNKNIETEARKAEEVEVLSCDVKYQDLVKMNYFDFSQCTNTDIRNRNIDIKESEIPTQSMVLIFDASGSMAATIDGATRMDIAKKSVRKFLKTLDGNEKFRLSIVLYGHEGSNSSSDKNISCNGIDEVFPMSVVNSVKAETIISSFSATGWTPIASSLQKAQSILEKEEADEKYILLVSDGKETCGGDPIEAVENIKSENAEIIVNVIGFDVDTEAGAELKAIASAGDGKYFDVSTEQQFAEALNENKKQLQKVDYALGRSIEQVYDISFLTNTYMQCTAALERENAVMQIDVNGTKLIGEECREYANTEYSLRYEELQEIIEENYTSGKKEFEQNASLIFER